MMKDEAGNFSLGQIFVSDRSWFQRIRSLKWYCLPLIIPYLLSRSVILELRYCQNKMWARLNYRVFKLIENSLTQCKIREINVSFIFLYKEEVFANLTILGNIICNNFLHKTRSYPILKLLYLMKIVVIYWDGIKCNVLQNK